MSRKRSRGDDEVSSVIDAYRLVSMREPTQETCASFPASLTPLDKQVIALRRSLPNSMLLLVVCGYKVKFYGRDSRVASRRLGIMCIPTSPFESSSVPVVRLPHYLMRLTEMGYHVAVADQVETAALRAVSQESKGGKLFERKITAVYSKATTSSAAFEALYQASAKPMSMSVSRDDDDALDELEDAGGASSAVAEDARAGVNQDRSLRYILFVMREDTTTTSSSLVSKSRWMCKLLSFVSLVCAPAVIIEQENLSSRLVEWVLRCEPCEIVCDVGSSIALDAVLEEANLTTLMHRGPTVSGDEDSQRIVLVNDVVVDDKRHQLSDRFHCLTESFAQRFMLRDAMTALREFSEKQLFSGDALAACMTLPVTSMASLHVTTGDYSRSFSHAPVVCSLLQLVDRCSTKVGSRTLRQWVGSPLSDVIAIRKRQSAVASLHADTDGIKKRIEVLLSEFKSHLTDPEATLSRLTLGRATVAETISFVQLLTCVRIHSRIHRDRLKGGGLTDLIYDLFESLHVASATQLVEHFVASINLKATSVADVFVGVASPPESTVRAFLEIEMAEAAIQAALEAIRAELNMPDLHYTTVAAVDYLIDLPQSKIGKGLVRIPEDWLVVSRTKSNVRYHPPLVVEAATHLCAAKDKLRITAEQVWTALQMNLLKEHATDVTHVREMFRAIGALDALLSLEKLACLPGYCIPTLIPMDSQPTPHICIRQGRHPILDAVMGSSYVAADVVMKPNGTWILTGPNMGGKSALMRMVGLIVVMAQIGASVPAASCEVPIFEAVFTRMGIEDLMLEHKSTFL